MTECIFCSIVEGKAPAHVIYEDEKHLAFLSIFPNTKGFSVVIPKEHHDSYFAAVDAEVASALVNAAQQVALRLDSALPGVGRTALVFEGFGVNHLHAKLIPLHNTQSDEWRAHHSKVEKYFKTYEGYVSSHDYVRADDAELAALAKHIRDAS